MAWLLSVVRELTLRSHSFGVLTKVFSSSARGPARPNVTTEPLMTFAHPETESSAPAWAWPLALAVATVLGTLATACMTPFIALAVMAAATLPRRRAAATLGAVWLVNQALGFTVSHYPLTAYAFSWGAAMGIASLAAMLVASLVVDPARTSATRFAAAFAAGFVTYEGLLFAFAGVEGGLSTFTPQIIGRIALNDGVWLVALAIVHLALTAGFPRVFGPRPMLRFA